MEGERERRTTTTPHHGDTESAEFHGERLNREMGKDRLLQTIAVLVVLRVSASLW